MPIYSVLDYNVKEINEALNKINSLEIEEPPQETSEEYFTINEKGVISLKPEYRGCPPEPEDGNDESYLYAKSDNGYDIEGSKINELPEIIVFPKRIFNRSNYTFAPGMFFYNRRIKQT